MWVDMIVELQSLAQAGLTYGKDAYDKERYERIREISAEMMSHIADIPLEKVKGLFCNEIGYQTPKIDTRAAIFKDDKILLVQEKDGTWSLPGGWCDVTVSVAENTSSPLKRIMKSKSKCVLIPTVQEKNGKHYLTSYNHRLSRVAMTRQAAEGRRQLWRSPGEGEWEKKQK